MIELEMQYNLDAAGRRFTSFDRKEQISQMVFTKNRIIILAVVVIAGIVLGRLAVRAALNLLVGGTLFGGNFL